MTLKEFLLVLALVPVLVLLLLLLGVGAGHSHAYANSHTKLRNVTAARVNALAGEYASRPIQVGPWSTRRPDQVASIADFAAALAYRSDFLWAQQWYVDEDVANADAVPWWGDTVFDDRAPHVLLGEGDARTINPLMGAPGPRDGSIAWATYAPMLPGELDSTLPVIWTRGLRSDGSWSDDGVFGKRRGGLIAFADGHIETHGFDGKPDADGLFVDRVKPGGFTNDWRRAVGTPLPGGSYKPFDGAELKSR